MVTTDARVLIHHPGGAPRSFPLSADRPQTIGRGSDCELRLNDDHCSRQHCVIAFQGDGWVLTDNGSRNGTLVNGERVSRHNLEEGDVIVVGSSWLVFTLAAPNAGGDDSDSGSDTSVGIPAFNPNARTVSNVGARGQRYADAHDETARMGGSADDTYLEPRSNTGRRRRRAVEQLLGESSAMRAVLHQIDNVAPTESTVLLRGESGVGKELVARAIHVQSRRANNRFVCVNCAALTESLLESELFGHERGAFTGATEMKRGKFEQADRGTLLLDEIGEMSPAIQAKFLRVLEGHPFERVGGQNPIQTDVRVIAATNTDLETAMREGRFRRDLYFRLNVLPIEIPPLRARKTDVPLLAKRFLEQCADQTGRPMPTLTPAAIERLTNYDWPGNVRELRNTLERAVILREGNVIDAGDLDFAGLDTAPIDESKFEGLSLEVVEMQHILRTLRATKWNKSRASHILGIERSTLDRKLKRHDVARPDDL